MLSEAELERLAITIAERHARGLIGERRQQATARQCSDAPSGVARFQSRLIYPSIHQTGDTANGGVPTDKKRGWHRRVDCRRRHSCGLAQIVANMDQLDVPMDRPVTEIADRS